MRKPWTALGATNRMSGSDWRYVFLILVRLLLRPISRYPFRHAISLSRGTQLLNVTERLRASQQKLLPANEVIEGLVLRAGNQFERAATKKALLKGAGSVSRTYSIMFYTITSCCDSSRMASIQSDVSQVKPSLSEAKMTFWLLYVPMTLALRSACERGTWRGSRDDREYRR